MKEKLTRLLNNSYSLYSNFKVSAIVVMNDGKEFNGVNVENATYGATICAERSAILSAISSGYKKGEFKELNIMCSSDKIATPCFLCRAVINEFFDETVKINCFNINGNFKVYSTKDLCPYPFGGENLK